MLASPSADYKAPSDIVATARLLLHGPTLPWIIDGVLVCFEDVDDTLLGLRLQEPLSCLNPRMGRPRNDIELRIQKDIDGCSWHETSPHAIHDRNGSGTRCRPTKGWS